MKKSYTVTRTQNGFLVRRDHLDRSYAEESQHVAHTLEEVVEIITDDLEVSDDTMNE